MLLARLRAALAFVVPQARFLLLRLGFRLKLQPARKDLVDAPAIHVDDLDSLKG